MGTFFSYYSASDGHLRDVRNPLARRPSLPVPAPAFDPSPSGCWGQRWAAEVASRGTDSVFVLLNSVRGNRAP